MKAYVLPSDKIIDPLEEPARDCLIANKPLKELQCQVLTKLGLEIVLVNDISEIDDEGEYILFCDNLYFTEALMAEFISRARVNADFSICALKIGTTTRLTAINLQEVKIHSHHVEYQLYYYPPRHWRTGSGNGIVIIDPDYLSFSIAMPYHMCGGDEYPVSLTEKLIVQIDHWVNLWIANVLTTLSGVAKLKSSSKLSQLWLAIKARSFNQWKILKQINKIGNNCDIDPTAIVEGSIIGDNVTVGAGAVIRCSIIGDRVNIGNNVVIEESVIGDKSTVLSGHIIYSVLYPSSFSVSGFVTASLMGRETFAGAGSVMTDFRFDNRNVIIVQNGRPVDSGNRFLGSCLGHGSYLGSGCVVAPGRSIPAGLHIVMDNSRVIHNPNDLNQIEGFRIIHQ